MARKKLTEDEVIAIDNEIQIASIPYDYDTKEYPTEVIIQKYQKDQIFVPTYQRKFVWTNKQRSRFIESVFLGVPIMPFLVSISGEEAELEIIDGSQRIRTLVEYCSNELKLIGLEKLTSLNGTTFYDLSKNRQNKFLLRDFRFHVVTERATPDVRADIFNRVNTSSNKLSPSETRNRVACALDHINTEKQLQDSFPEAYKILIEIRGKQKEENECDSVESTRAFLSSLDK